MCCLCEQKCGGEDRGLWAVLQEAESRLQLRLRRGVWGAVITKFLWPLPESDQWSAGVWFTTITLGLCISYVSCDCWLERMQHQRPSIADTHRGSSSVQTLSSTQGSVLVGLGLTAGIEFWHTSEREGRRIDYSRVVLFVCWREFLEFTLRWLQL